MYLIANYPRNTKSIKIKVGLAVLELLIKTIF